VTADDVADQKVSALESLLVFVDHPSDMKPLPDKLLILLGQAREDLANHLDDRAPAELADHVLLGPGHDQGAADRAAPLPDDRPNGQRSSQLECDRALR